MKYLLLICLTDEFDLTEEEAAVMGDDTDEWVQQMQARGVRIGGHQLYRPDEARTVRVRLGKVAVTNGPFAEAGELMAGFDLLECRDLDEAIEVAAAHPMARHGEVEVRPMMEDD